MLRLSQFLFCVCRSALLHFSSYSCTREYVYSSTTGVVLGCIHPNVNGCKALVCVWEKGHGQCWHRH